MNAFENLQKLAAEKSVQELINALGYPSRHAGERALKQFLKARHLEAWLQNYGYDGTHGARSFIRALARALDRYDDDFVESLEAVENALDDYPEIPQPYIFVDTGFRRRSEPIVALAAMEGKRRLKVPKREVLGRPLVDVFEKIAKIVCDHYAETGGDLPLWGEIRGYVYYHIDGSRHDFDTDGKPARTPLDGDNSRATLRI